MPRFKGESSPDKRVEQLKSQIKQAIAASGLDSEQAKKVFDQAISELQQRQPAHEPTAENTNEVEAVISRVILCMPKTEGISVTQKEVGNFTGRKVGRKEYELEQLSLSEISRGRLFDFACVLGIRDQLASQMEGTRNDDPVALNVELSPGGQKKGGPIIKTQFAEGMQEMGFCEFIMGETPLTDIQIHFDEGKHPMLVTIRAKY